MILESIPLAESDVVSIVGSGGKTNLMFALARELVSQGHSVITTTTTRILPPGPKDSPITITTEDEEEAVTRVREGIERSRHVTVGSTVEEGKLKGVSPESIAEMVRNRIAHVILVEADGSRQRPLKAPNETEPVTPACTTMVIVVLGLDGVGKPNTEKHVFRSDYFARMGGVAVGDEVTPESVARALFHPHGLLRDVPKSARIVAVLNKADCQELLDLGGRLAQLIVEQGSGSISSALVTRMHPAPQVLLEIDRCGMVSQKAAKPMICGVILAAGESQRMGKPKLLLPWKGSTLIERAVDIYEDSAVAEIIVVSGAETEGIGNVLRGRRVTVVNNEEYRDGMATSIKRGIDAASSKADAYLIALADQPLITTEIVDLLIGGYIRKEPLIGVAVHEGKRGHPVIFHKSLRAELCALQGDEGGRSIIRRYAAAVQNIEVGSSAIFADVDTPEDYRRIAPGP